MSIVKQVLQEASCEAIGGNEDFSHVVRAAVGAFEGAKLRTAAENGVTASLILWLLSDRPLDRGDRILLATLLAGEMHPTGRRTKTLEENQDDRALAFDALTRKYELVAKGSKAIDAEGEAAEWFAGNDPRARGRTDETIRRLMQDAAPAWRVLQGRKAAR
jgi:hypothetical protein